jgi:hypothetical protein
MKTARSEQLSNKSKFGNEKVENPNCRFSPKAECTEQPNVSSRRKIDKQEFAEQPKLQCQV